MTPQPPYQELLARLLPPVSYSPDGPRLQAELASEGAALDRAQTSARQLAGAVTPWQAEGMLPDWERVCGLTPQLDATYQQRQQAVLAKLAETGGLSIPYFVRLAAGMGYKIQIAEPQPFRAGINRAGQHLCREDIPWAWWVTVFGSKSRSYQFRAGQSLAGERLTAFGDPKLEELFNDLKPAHTHVNFAYLP
ncbi:YmfQ family protein [Chromobacterium alticapitis]|uniref:Phage tail protein n=1 Tax=Chromobacterium alticapitis TaxID=2073169 RepID=A0A2S5DKK2_9NEIS|nr:putative phage tail protein [Chromobacterium alticapitis]POZ63574.1 phage tail protein [Chromobacterium alticapitis]